MSAEPAPVAPAGTATANGLPTTAIAVVGGAFVLAVGLGHSLDLANSFRSYGFNAVGGLAFGFMGALIVPRRPGNAVGWLFLATGAAHMVIAISACYGQVPAMAWLQQAALPLPIGLVALLLLLFPDGHFISPAWRPAAAGAVATTVGTALAIAVAVARTPRLLLEYDTTTAVHDSATVAAAVGMALVAGSLVVAVISLAVRWRRASGVVRQQLRLLAAGGFLLVLGLVVDFGMGVWWLWPTLGLVVPVCAGVATLQYRLYDADVALNRSLVYLAVAGVLLAAYLGTVTALGSLFSQRSARLSPLVATGVVAVLFEPARARVRRSINRVFFGARDDPEEVLSDLSRGLHAAGEPAAVLSTVVRTTAEALRLPYAAIAVPGPDGDEVIAQHGQRITETWSFSMLYQGRVVGHFVAAQRTLSEQLTRSERNLLGDIAIRAAIVVHANRLTVDLRRSRERLVRSREEERRRIRRDLHDGLGPTLAGMMMQVGAAQARLDDGGWDVVALSHMLHGLEQQLQASVSEIRRLVDNLRPPSLDQLGLVGALEQRITAFASNSPGVHITVSAPDPVRELPAAVEVAAYRIAMEAVTNVMRHAGASRCTVTIAVGGSLVVEVRDDGRGLGEGSTPGIGLASMRERAEELGGTLDVTGDRTGTCVHAELPASEGSP